MDLSEIRKAAAVADWHQVVRNGGPPCFHVEDGRFCFRAERWDGHGIMHEFVDFRKLIQRLSDAITDGGRQ